MNRRSLLASLCTLPVARHALAGQPEWQARLVAGDFDGAVWTAGLHIMLAPGWKTYWRVPGDAGVPPQIKMTGQNLAAADVDFPLPIRIDDASGEAIGYHDEVLFPLRLKPIDAKVPLSINLSSFFGVCQEICKPVKFDAELSLSAKSPPSPAGSLIKAWQDKVPRPADFVTAANTEEKHLLLQVSEALDDIFVEGPDRLYFGKPGFSGPSARLKIAGMKDGESLVGTQLRITAAAMGKGLEQMVMVA